MFRFIFLGKTKNGPNKDLTDDYFRRLKKLAKAEMIELKEEKIKKESDALKKEAESILKHVDKSSFTICLDSRGKELTSREFSKLIDTNKDKDIVFITGSATGLDEKIVKTSDFVLSISRMTLTHQMIRSFLIEQTYRAMTILKGIPYHK